jgi:hypothetical protein
VVIGEGWEDVAFLAGFLDQAGIGSRQRTPLQNPKGRGSGFDFVRKCLPEELLKLRRFAEGRGVVAMIDEDGKSVEARLNWVSQRIPEKSADALDCSAGRCLLIPKRNLETWTYWLTGRIANEAWAVSEEANYKTSKPDSASRRLENADFRAAGKHLHTLDHTSPPEGMPDQLMAALASLRAFVGAVRR